MPLLSDFIDFEGGRTFYSTVCQVCKFYPDGVNTTEPLKRCNGCKLIYYCSAGHQQNHWIKHKQFCRLIQKLARLANRAFIFENLVDASYQEWCKERVKFKILCELELRRVLTMREFEMLFFPRVCLVCFRHDLETLRECDKCHCISYCSQEHMEQDAESHRKVCYQLQFGFELDVRPVLPLLKIVKGRLKRRGICHTSDEFCSQFMEGMSFAEDTSTNALASRLHFIAWTCPLTFIYAVFRSGLHLSSSLVVHVVGASGFETQHVPMWDIVFHWLSNLRTLHLVFIGPEVLEPTYAIRICEDCKKLGNKLCVEFCPNVLYHSYAESPVYSKPDFIVLYNCGICEWNGTGKDSWHDTIPFIMQSNCPVLITSYTHTESVNNLARLNGANLNLDTVIQNEKNIFACTKAIRDWEKYYSPSDDLIFYHNGYISLLTPCK